MTADNKLAIEWANHASFVVAYKGVRLITDPWLFGSAFNNGWNLLSETRFQTADWDAITHIWLSHEHPDHFSPPVLKSIPEATRRKITFLFQNTEDHKVKRYCEGLGFTVVEMDHRKSYDLTADFTISCAPVLDDSWLFIKTPELKILNINDCVVNKPYIAEEIKKHSGEVDILMTQYSYANWVGNPDDYESRRQNALEKLGRIELQIDTFKPSFVVPFASFVWFSHKENFYLNDSVNRISDVAKQIRDWGCTPIVMYPADKWTVGENYDSQPAIDRYERDFSELEKRELAQSETCEWSDIEAAMDKLVSRVKGQNNMALVKLGYRLKLFRAAKIYLTDRKEAYCFDIIKGLSPLNIPEEQCDISMHSESLLYAIKFDWGADTLHVNGRFVSPNGNSYLNFFINFFIPKHNNNGRGFPFGVMSAYIREGLFLNMIKRLTSVRLSS